MAAMSRGEADGNVPLTLGGDEEDEDEASSTNVPISSISPTHWMEQDVSMEILCIR